MNYRCITNAIRLIIPLCLFVVTSLAAGTISIDPTSGTSGLAGVKCNSIIAIQGDDQPPNGADGVVQYTSAHVDYAESEFIVRSGHSRQMNPLTIEEVRRILLEQLGETTSVK